MFAALLMPSIDKPGVYSGSVLHNSHLAWKRNAVHFQSLDKLAKRVRRLERDVAGARSDSDQNPEEQS